MLINGSTTHILLQGKFVSGDTTQLHYVYLVISIVKTQSRTCNKQCCSGLLKTCKTSAQSLRNVTVVLRYHSLRKMINKCAHTNKKSARPWNRTADSSKHKIKTSHLLRQVCSATGKKIRKTL